LDVDVVEVTPPKPDPLAEAAPRPALVPAKLVVAVAHHHPREVASARLLASNPAPVDPSAPAEAPGPATPAPPALPAVALSQGPAARPPRVVRAGARRLCPRLEPGRDSSAVFACGRALTLTRAAAPRDSARARCPRPA